MAVYALTRGEPPVTSQPAKLVDAAVVVEAPKTGNIEIRTTPPGAKGMINGVPIKGVTPGRAVNLPVGPQKIHLELAGYLPIEYEVVLEAGQTLVVDRSFVAAPATLNVKTDPAGATVMLEGRSLGTTPLVRADLVAAQGQRISLTKPGYETLAFPVDLVAGTTLTLERTLKEVKKIGTVTVFVVSMTVALLLVVGTAVVIIARPGLVLTDLVEPEWPEHNDSVWGGWSPLRGALLPGTLIVVADRP